MFVYEMRGRQFGRDALMQAWEFFRAGWELSLGDDVHLGEVASLRDKVRVAEAARDDARAHSQKLLDENRELRHRMKGLEK